MHAKVCLEIKIINNKTSSERILPDTSINLWYHWMGMTVSGSSRRNLFRTLAMVENPYPDKSTPITSARKQTSNNEIETSRLGGVNTNINRFCQKRSVNII
jgi:hypothetical protein